MQIPKLTYLFRPILLAFTFLAVLGSIAEAAEIMRSWSTVRKEQGLMVNYVSAVAEAPDGSVWFGTGAGVSHFDGRVWTHHTTEQGLPGILATNILVDERGDVWAASGEAGAPTFASPWLARFRDGEWKEFPLPPRVSIRQLLEVDGRILAATRLGVMQVSDAGISFQTVKDGLQANSIAALIQVSDGSLMAFHRLRGRGSILGERDRPSVSILPAGESRWERHPLSAELRDVIVRTVVEDQDGGLWIGTAGDGVKVYQSGKLHSMTVSDGLPSDNIGGPLLRAGR